jgi:sialidase-1
MIERQDLWLSNDGAFHTYRIPALCVTPKGTVLAFCEGRKHSRADAGEIDLLLRRSTDGGHTWLPTQTVATHTGMTVGNPAPVVDRDTGTIWLLLCKNPSEGGEEKIRKGLAERTVWLTHSTDDGLTWADAIEITSDVKRPDWTWYATGPCHGIQLASGRLVIPCDHRVRPTGERDEGRRSHVVYADDHGATWRIGGIVEVEGTNECAAVELPAGSDNPGGAVYLSCRDQEKRGRRVAAWSHDGGLSFSDTRFDDALLEPACQASLVRLTTPDGRHLVLHCNPASATRDTLTVKLSNDGCRTWTTGRILEPGRAAYSDLAVLPDNIILCLYERGAASPYDALTLARFDLAWLEGNPA